MEFDFSGFLIESTVFFRDLITWLHRHHISLLLKTAPGTSKKLTNAHWESGADGGAEFEKERQVETQPDPHRNIEATHEQKNS